jgi:hypothetical protein
VTVDGSHFRFPAVIEPLNYPGIEQGGRVHFFSLRQAGHVSSLIEACHRVIPRVAYRDRSMLSSTVPRAKAAAPLDSVSVAPPRSVPYNMLPVPHRMIVVARF